MRPVSLVCSFICIAVLSLFVVCGGKNGNSPTDLSPHVDTLGWSLNITLGSFHTDSLKSDTSTTIKAATLSTVTGHINQFPIAAFDSVDILLMGSRIASTDSAGNFSFSGKMKLLEGYQSLAFKPQVKNGYAANPSQIKLIVNVLAF